MANFSSWNRPFKIKFQINCKFSSQYIWDCHISKYSPLKWTSCMSWEHGTLMIQKRKLKDWSKEVHRKLFAGKTCQKSRAECRRDLFWRFKMKGQAQKNGEQNSFSKGTNTAYRRRSCSNFDFPPFFHCNNASKSTNCRTA